MKVFKFLVNLTIALGFLFVAMNIQQLQNWQIRSQVGPSVVKVLDTNGGGTGWYFNKDKKTFVITNNHICLESDTLRIIDEDGSEVMANVVKRSKVTDLCAIELPIHKQGLRLAGTVYKGEMASVVGHPELRPLTIQHGEIIGKDYTDLILGANLPDDRCFGKQVSPKDLDLDPIMQMLYELAGIKKLCWVHVPSTLYTGTSYPGNSGSPVVDLFGSVIGVLFAGSTPNGVSLVPLEDVKTFIDEL